MLKAYSDGTTASLHMFENFARQTTQKSTRNYFIPRNLFAGSLTPFVCQCQCIRPK